MASVWAELKRRNVVKVAVAYAIVGWLLVEVSSTVFPIVQLPDWTVTFLTMLILFGFPIALILSWAYEITPEGMKRSHEVEATESITHITGRKIDFAIIGALVLALGFVVYNYVLVDPDQEAVVQETTPDVDVTPESSPPVLEEQREVLPNSVAVLPFRNDSPDPDNAYYASGIHEEILNYLVKLSALSVIARTSVEQYRNTEKSIPEIAEELNVETVMEGSVRYAGGQIRITTQLNDGVTGAHLWSETYTRDFDDIFAIESDVAMNVANALEAEFSLEEQASIEKAPTNSAEAYSLYLRSLATLGLPDIQYLDQATAVDPDFALAYAMKAYSLAYDTGAFDAPDFASVSENANRALRLDPTLGLADAALAFLHMGNRRWAEAEQAFQQALRRSPNEPEVLMMYSRFNRYRGEYAEGVRLARRAVELDPHNPLFQFQLATAYRYAQNDNAAVSALRIALDLSPAHAGAHAQLAYAEISRDNVAEALRELQIAEQLFGENLPDWRIAQLADGYAQLGRREDVMRLFGELEERDRQSPVREAVWAKAYIARGDYQEALQRLEAAINDPAPSSSDTLPLGQIKANVHSDPVLDEPRFLELRDRIGT